MRWVSKLERSVSVGTKRIRTETERSPGAIRISRGDFLKISGAGLVGASLLGVAGCGGGGGGQQGGGGGGGGNTITVGYDQEPEVLNRMHISGTALATTSTTAGIMQSPIRILPDLSYGPLLADGMPELVSEDPQVVEYKLKKNLTWSDGKPLTSADAKFTFEQIMNPDNDLATRTGWDDVESFETPDELTVRMTFSQPYAPWRDLLVDTWPIIPKHVYEGKDWNKAMSDEIVGSGPYKFKEWKTGEYLIVEENENYWGEKPAIKQFTYKFIPDSNTLITSLESGEVSFIYPPPDIGLLERLRSIEGTQVNYKAGVVWEHIAFNVEKVPNLKMRQALAYGINREQIVNELLQGQVNTLHSYLVPEQEPYYTPAWERYTYDPDRVKQLVKEAKAEGASTTINFSTTSDNRLRETLQELVQQQLKKLGITINIKNTSSTTFFAEWTPQGNYEMAEWAWLATPDPTQTVIFAADEVPTDKDPAGQNWYWYKDEEVTRLLKESDRTLDVQQRAQLLKRAQEQMAEDLPILPMYQRPEYYAYSDDLVGPDVNPTTAGPFWNMGDWRWQ
jgi:peptide/nickel transport system substrate-binding protein